MGQGCSKTYTDLSCPDKIFDKCVFYTGETILELEICHGDSYFEIIQKVLEFMQKPEPLYPELRDKCDKIKNLIGDKDPTLITIIEAILIQICTFNTSIETIKETINKPAFIYDLKCLVISGTVSTETVLQKLISDFCDLKTALTTLSQEFQQLKSVAITTNGSNGGSTNNTSIVTALQSVIEAENLISVKNINNKIVLSGFLQPYIPVPYIGPTSNFDSTGKGIASLGWKDWYLMNGNNGTQDWRGFTFAGATNVQGTAVLHPDVDPNIPTNGYDFATNIGDIKGKVKTKIEQNNIPNHTHSGSVNIVNNGSTGTNSHAHMYEKYLNYDNCAPAPKGVGFDVPKWSSKTPSLTSSTNLPTSSSSLSATYTDNGVSGVQNQPMENRQPTRYGMWVVWIPQ